MKQIAFVLTLALCLASVSPLLAGVSAPHSMVIDPPTSTISSGGEVPLAVLLSCTDAIETQGWSFAVKLVNDASVTSSITWIEFGDEMSTAQDGDRPWFENTSFYEAGALQAPIECNTKTKPAAGKVFCRDPGVVNGVALSQGVVISQAGDIILPGPVSNFELVKFRVKAEGPAGEFAKVQFATDVGDPPVANAVVIATDSFTPGTLAEASIGFRSCVAANDFTIDVQGGKGGTNAVVESLVTLNFNDNGGNAGGKVLGWSYGICVQDATKLRIASVADAATSDGTDTGSLNGGDGPWTDSISIFNDPAGIVGVTHGVIIDQNTIVSIPAPNGWTDLKVKYEVLMTAAGESTMVTACDKTIGNNPRLPVANVYSKEGVTESIPGIHEQILDPASECCDPEACNHPGKFEFLSSINIIPGNANGDSRLDIADGIFVLNYLFHQGATPPCMCAADADNSGGNLEPTDAILIIRYVLDAPEAGQTDPVPPALGIGCKTIQPSDCAMPCAAPGC